MYKNIEINILNINPDIIFFKSFFVFFVFCTLFVIFEMYFKKICSLNYNVQSSKILYTIYTNISSKISKFLTSAKIFLYLGLMASM